MRRYILTIFLTIIAGITIKFCAVNGLHIIFGIPLVIFLPGYAITHLLFSNTNRLTVYELLALYFGLSIIVVIFIGLVLSFTFKFTKDSILISMMIVTVSAAVIGLCRSDRQHQKFKIFACLKKNMSMLTIVVIFVILISTVSVCLISESNDRYTEFYIRPEEGEDYSTTFLIGDYRKIIVGVVNHEDRRTQYTILITTNLNEKNITYTENWRTTYLLNSNITVVRNITVNKNENWEDTFHFRSLKNGTYTLNFILLKDTKPYRRVWLNLTTTTIYFKSTKTKVIPMGNVSGTLMINTSVLEPGNYTIIITVGNFTKNVRYVENFNETFQFENGDRIVRNISLSNRSWTDVLTFRFDNKGVYRLIFLLQIDNQTVDKCDCTFYYLVPRAGCQLQPNPEQYRGVFILSHYGVYIVIVMLGILSILMVTSKFRRKRKK